MVELSFDDDHTASSRQRYEADERHYPGAASEMDYVGTFTSVLGRNNPQCRETFRAAGDTFFDFDENGRTELVARLRTIWPPLPLIQLPSKCPTAISTEITSASAVVWISFATAVSRLRSAVERLLDDKGIERPVRGRPTLADRIRTLGTQEPPVQDLLSAVTWSGNAGAHGETVKFEDVVDAAEILERALALLYGTDDVARRAREINLRKGPIS